MGMERGTSNLLLGPPGVGKSTLAMRCAVTLAEKGENGFIDFNYYYDDRQLNVFTIILLANLPADI